MRQRTPEYPMLRNGNVTSNLKKIRRTAREPYDAKHTPTFEVSEPELPCPI